MKAPTDEELLSAFLEGDRASFELLVHRHIQELHQFSARFTLDPMAAEDVVQDTFLQVYHSAGSFDPKRRFKPWLFTIAANKARDHLRRRNRRRELPLEARIAEDDDSGQRFLDLFSSDVPLPDEGLRLDETRQAVRAAVDTVPEKLREVLILAYYHRMPYQDIAEVVGIPVGTVKSRLHAAVAAFRHGYQTAIR